MKYPTLSELYKDREMIDVFKGYNHNLRIGEGEFYDMKNLSSDNYPVLSPRKKRGIYLDGGIQDIQGIIAKDSLCYVRGGKFVINGNENTAPDFNMASGNKTLISMGAYVIIMPDRKYINTENPNDHGNIDVEFIATASTTFSLCKVDGIEYENTVIRDTAPSITDAMRAGTEAIPLWIDTSGETHSLKMYSLSSDSWTSIASTYIKISSAGIGTNFEVGDGVQIIDSEIEDLNGYATIMAKDDDFIVVRGILAQTHEQNAPISVARRMPEMDFIVEAGNRLWGCHYGIANNGAIVNEIYASKLGDFKNWTVFSGISTDSYVASVGTDGKFTGAITHLGYPIFFKENYMHKVYGNYPANFQIQTTACRGVQDGSSKSLSIVNEVLYYKSRSAVCAYDGSLPVEVSSAFGDKQYYHAVAGTLGNKYYISMSDAEENGEYHLFVLDTQKSMWHKEDDTKAEDFCSCRGNLYYIADNKIMAVRGAEVEEEPNHINWEAETGIIGTDSPDKKYVSRLDVRMSLEVGARALFFIEYDSSGEWEYLFTMTGVRLGSFAVPIRPHRCDHMRIKIVGKGEAKIFSICKTIEQGSDV